MAAKKKQVKRNMVTLSMEFYVAGVQYQLHAQHLTFDRANVPLIAVWERNNRFDKYAVRLQYNSISLGYLPKAMEYKGAPLNEYLTQLRFKNNITPKFTLIEFNGEAELWRRFKVRVSWPVTKQEAEEHEYTF